MVSFSIIIGTLNRDSGLVAELWITLLEGEGSSIRNRTERDDDMKLLHSACSVRPFPDWVVIEIDFANAIEALRNLTCFSGEFV